MANEPPDDFRSPKRRREIARQAGVDPNTLKRAIEVFGQAVRPPRIELPRFEFPDPDEFVESMARAEDAKRHAMARAVSPVIEQHTRPLWQAIDALRASQERSARQLMWLTLLILALTSVIAAGAVAALLQ